MVTATNERPGLNEIGKTWKMEVFWTSYFLWILLTDSRQKLFSFQIPFANHAAIPLDWAFIFQITETFFLYTCAWFIFYCLLDLIFSIYFTQQYFLFFWNFKFLSIKTILVVRLHKSRATHLFICYQHSIYFSINSFTAFQTNSILIFLDAGISYNFSTLSGAFTSRTLVFWLIFSTCGFPALTRREQFSCYFPGVNTLFFCNPAFIWQPIDFCYLTDCQSNEKVNGIL